MNKVNQVGKPVKNIQMMPKSGLDKSITHNYLTLPQPENGIQVMYVWIDGSGQNLRSKTRTMDFVPESPEDCPIWTFDGSSTGQAVCCFSDVYLHPVALFKCPFRRGNNKILLCETYEYEDKPTKSNFRRTCKKVMDKVADHKPWFGIEQEYMIMDTNGNAYGKPKDYYPGQECPFYCSVGADRAFGRDLLEAHYRACLYAGIKISGTNAEVAYSQWEYQIGPCEGIDIGDHLWIARFILLRIAEEFGVNISFSAKPDPNRGNCSGAHCNYSTLKMREPNGILAIEEAIHNLRLFHDKHIQVYDPNGGKDNELRLTGEFETSDIKCFTYGVGNRKASVRIPRFVKNEGCGYLEDRRPSANSDPYRVTEAIVRSTLWSWEEN